MLSRHCAATTFALLIASTVHAGTQTVGVFVNEPEAYDGYTLFCPLTGTTNYLIDNAGQIRHTWESTLPPGNSLYLRPNGNLVRCADPRGNPVMAAGGDAGRIEEYDWDGNVVWSYDYNDSLVRAHHDIALLPNGNILILAWEWKSDVEAIQAGRDPALLSGSLWPEHIVEVEPDGPTGGNIVWRWNMWDHLIQDFDATKDNFGVVADHPELFDINFGGTANPDWIHANAIDYNEQLDQIMFNSPRLNEVWVIDHSTTTEQAAGHTGGFGGKGGDILYRWGNPQAYDKGIADDQQWFGQHNVQWIDSGLPGGGNILAFNNGSGRPAGAFTTIEEIAPPIDLYGFYEYFGVAYGPPAPTWTYMDDPATNFYSSFISGAQRLPNGNTLICSGAWGTLFEVDSLGNVVWLYVSPATPTGPLVQGDPVPNANPNSYVTRMFRAERYPTGYPAFDGRDLTPQGTIELLPCDADTDGNGAVDVDDLVSVILDWGTDGSVNGGDVDGSGVVDVDDLVAVILGWGPCP